MIPDYNDSKRNVLVVVLSLSLGMWLTFLRVFESLKIDSSL